MNHTNDIRIKGIDKKRWPNLNNKKYIDVYYELSEKAPRDWCLDFNQFFSKERNRIKINPDRGEFIETWVREMEEIPSLLHAIKDIVAKCNDRQTEKSKREYAANQASYNETKTASHNKLEEILASLQFEEST